VEAIGMNVGRKTLAKMTYDRYFPGKRWPWFGYPIIKYPDDMMAYQMILTQTRPELLIECGTGWAGSALYFAHLFDLMKQGEVISIDVKPRVRRLPKHKRITFLRGSSLDKEILQTVTERSKQKRCMVVLDSNHHYEHVIKEIRAYYKFVSPGCFLVVEDTFLNGHPSRSTYGPGPWEAVEKFMAGIGKKHFDRPADYNERLITMNPGGWLQRKDT
jgi:cephalosporin hydroxylase